METLYPWLKNLHVACALASIALFLLRGVWMIATPERLKARWVRIVPHVNDTVLLAAAIALTTIVGEYPFVDDWLTAKVIALLGYIGLGMVALKRGRTLRVRVAAWLAAIALYGYMLAVAVTRTPMPWTAG